eukprot:527528_1
MALLVSCEEKVSSVIIDVHLFDEVILADKAVGIVKFIGEVKNKNGLFFGLDLKKGKGKNNGCIKNRRYFRTRKDKENGRFTQLSKIVKHTKTLKSIPFTVGDTLQCPQLNTTAIIRYVGIPAFDKTMKTVHFGIELAEPKGDCNGEIYSAYLGRKISYFKCESNYGLYIKSTEITVNYASNDKNTENQKQFDNNTYDDEKATDNNQSDEIRRQQIETLTNNESDYEQLLKEYNEYKSNAERDKYKMDEIEKELQETNALLNNKTEEINDLKQELNGQKDRNEYDKLLVEFNEYKEKYNIIEQVEEKEDINELKLMIKKLTDSNNKWKDKYNKMKQKVSKLTGQNLSNGKHAGNNSVNNIAVSSEYSTELLEKELEALRSKSKTNKKQRLSGVLTKFAATDAKSAIIILKQILKQWKSQFISKNSRVEYLKNFEQILSVIGNSMDVNTKNDELDPIIKQVVDIIQKCRDDNDNSIRNTAAELCQNDIILQFMMR